MSKQSKQVSFFSSMILPRSSQDPIEYRKATGGKPFSQELMELRSSLEEGELDLASKASKEADLTWLGALHPATQVRFFKTHELF